MIFKIITLVKQVPDTQNVCVDAMKPDGTINRAALPAITNPEDLNALEEALKIKEKFGAVITAISLGPTAAVKVLKESLYRGVDDAVLVTDTKFAASDTLATSYALTCAIKKVGDFQLIICGRQAIDGDTAQVGAQIAEKLGINQLTGVKEILSLTEETITVRRVIEGGYEILSANLPILVTVVAEANQPRFARAKRLMAYKNINCKNAEAYDETYMFPECNGYCDYIKQWSAADLKADLSRCGLTGSPTKVKNIQNVVLTAPDTRMLENNDATIKELMRELIAEHILA